MEIIITSSSLDPKQNVSGISSVTQFILLKNKTTIHTGAKVCWIESGSMID